MGADIPGKAVGSLDAGRHPAKCAERRLLLFALHLAGNRLRSCAGERQAGSLWRSTQTSQCRGFDRIFGWLALAAERALRPRRHGQRRSLGAVNHRPRQRL
jgi:hypothetical protein